MAALKNHTREMLEALKLERHQLLEQIDRLGRRLEKVESTLMEYGVRDPRPRTRKPTQPPQGGEDHPSPDETPISYKDFKQGDAAFNFLKENGKELHVNQIATGLLKRGITLRADIY